MSFILQYAFYFQCVCVKNIAETNDYFHYQKKSLLLSKMFHWSSALTGAVSYQKQPTTLSASPEDNGL